MRTFKRKRPQAPSWCSWLVATSLMSLLPHDAAALPIGFGHNQGRLRYQEIKTDHFIVYHDARAPHEARLIVNSLESARPVLEKWLDVQRSSHLPVIMTAVADNASFANFITDAVELQTLGQGGRDLAWHEYVHSTMYRQLDNWLGPAGSVIHLPWMPAWFIEGLAESLSVSVLSDEQAAVERYQALTGQWTSYEKLHALYGKGAFAHVGYAISGAFTSYVLRTYSKATTLPQLIRDFYHYSMPWWWPWTLVPFNGFLPMDAALENMTGKNGRELYEEYKRAATAYWQKNAKGPFLQAPADEKPATFASLNAVQIRQGKVWHALRDGDLFEAEMVFSKNRWAIDWRNKSELPDDLASLQRIVTPQYRILVGENRDGDFPGSELRVSTRRSPDPKTVLKLPGYITGLYEAADRIYWLEMRREQAKFCYLPKNQILARRLIAAKNVRCLLDVKQPVSLRPLGTASRELTPGHTITDQVWLAVDEATMLGDRHKVFAIPLGANKPMRPLPLSDAARPVAITRQAGQLWMAAAGRNYRFLRKLSSDGTCLEERLIANHLEKLQTIDAQYLLLGLFENGTRRLLKLDPQELPRRACTPVQENHTSPLLYAMRHGPNTSLNEALAHASLWHEPDLKEQAIAAGMIAKAPRGDVAPVGQNAPVAMQSREAAWRGRQVFYFPWIGADALGTQAGIISVPLMDEMQNETVRVTFLLGLATTYPQTEVSLLSTRFRTTIQFDAFRTQAFNGAIYRRSTGTTQTQYYDEKGVRLTLSNTLGDNGHAMYGTKYSNLTPYIGLHDIRRGNHTELFLNLDHTLIFSSTSWNNYITSAAAPKEVNKEFEYDKLGAGTTFSFPIPIPWWRTSTFKLGLAASRTRGPKRKILQEVYRPLNTFVPGTGGGLNEINVGITGPGLLTSAIYGDTQGKAKASWSFPLVPDFEKLLGIIYLNRLDLTAFYNYGGAWYGDKAPTKEQLVGAHGYNLDLQADIKGITLNTGLGTGQVVRKPWEVYFLFGFDAIIN